MAQLLCPTPDAHREARRRRRRNHGERHRRPRRLGRHPGRPARHRRARQATGTRPAQGRPRAGQEGATRRVHGRRPRRRSSPSATSTTPSSCSRDCDLVLEAIIEQPAPKQALYARLEPLLKATAIVRRNTSGIPMQHAHRGAQRRVPRALPRHALLQSAALSASARDHSDAGRPTPRRSTPRARFSERVLGKGIVVAKDVPGFVANRLGVFGMVLAMRLDGVTASRSTKSTCSPARSSAARSAPTFRTADITGLDVLLHVAKGLSASDGRGLLAARRGCEQLVASGRSARRPARASTRRSARRSRRSTGRRSSTARSRRSRTRRSAR